MAGCCGTRKLCLLDTKLLWCHPQVTVSYAQSKGLLLKQRTISSLATVLLTAALVIASVVRGRAVAGRSLASVALLVLLSVQLGASLLLLLYDALR